MQRVLGILTDGLKAIEGELELAEKAVSALSSMPEMKNSQALADQIQGRDRLSLQADTLKRTIANVKAFGVGVSVVSEPKPPVEPRPVKPGQYTGMKLTGAVQAYLSERDGGPVGIATIVKDLIVGACKIIQTRSKYQKDQPRDPDTRDLRRLANSNRKRFQYDVRTDSLSLRNFGEGNGLTVWKTSKRDNAEPRSS